MVNAPNRGAASAPRLSGEAIGCCITLTYSGGVTFEDFATGDCVDPARNLRAGEMVEFCGRSFGVKTMRNDAGQMKSRDCIA